MDGRPRYPYAAPPPFYKNTYDTTYGKSYQNVRTFDVSPVYDKFHHAPYPYDFSPYPTPRDDPRKQNSTYQMEEQYRRDVDRPTLRRDEYHEPLPPSHEMWPPNQADDRYDGQFDDRHRRRFDPQYRDQLARDEPIPDDARKVFCHKCFRPNVCVNRLSCNHQYCDECMRELTGSDNPFRDRIGWHYKCDKCEPPSWTSEMKLIRLNPFGQRLIRYNDVRNYDVRE